MHPLRSKLRRYVDGTLGDTELREISAHIAECEFCREFCDDYRELINSLNAEADTSEIGKLGDRLFSQAFPPKIIELKPVLDEPLKPKYSLAADAEPEKRCGIYSLATLGSENPEVVLRVMRNADHNRDYLELLGADSQYVSNVLIEIPELGREVLTNAEGRADLETPLPEQVAGMKWRIKLPEASFSLSPLKYDPEKTEYAQEQILQTDRHDKVQIRFEGKTSGKKLSIRLLEIEGRKDFGPVRVVIAQKQISQSHLVDKTNQEIRFDMSDSSEEIHIRLFSNG